MSSNRLITEFLLQQQCFFFKLEKVNNKLKPCTHGDGKPLFQEVFRSHNCFIFSGNLPIWHCVMKAKEMVCPQHAAADAISPLLLYALGCVAQNVLQRTQVSKTEINTWTQQMRKPLMLFAIFFTAVESLSLFCPNDPLRARHGCPAKTSLPSYQWKMTKGLQDSLAYSDLRNWPHISLAKQACFSFPTQNRSLPWHLGDISVLLVQTRNHGTTADCFFLASQQFIGFPFWIRGDSQKASDQELSEVN